MLYFCNNQYSWLCSNRDGDFLASFAVFAEPLKEANAAAHEFSSTYLFLKEYTTYAVEKILHIYTQLLQVSSRSLWNTPYSKGIETYMFVYHNSNCYHVILLLRKRAGR